MSDFEDYYETLQVHHLAEPEVIQKAFTALANKYHPDKNPSAAAAAKMRKINYAYDVLKDPDKRKQYDTEWKSRKQAPKPAVEKPRPVVEPSSIRFPNAEPNTIQRSSFIIRNAGGSYKKIWFSNPGSWVKVTRYTSLSESDELPLKVELEAVGNETSKDYVEFITVRLDNEETKVRIDLSTQAVPISKPKPVPNEKLAGFFRPLWIKLTVGIALLAFIALAVFLLIPYFTKDNEPSSATQPSVTVTSPGQMPATTSPSTTMTSGGLLLTEIDLSPIANFTTRINGLPSGFRTFNGVPFYIAENQIFTTQHSTASLPVEGSVNMDISRPQNVYILINTTSTFQQFMNKQAGNIKFVFDNGASEVTYLIVGQNVREYTADSATVQTVTDPATQMIWQGGDPAFLIDMLTIPVSSNNQSRILKQVIISDVSQTMTDSPNPGLIIWGLTVAHYPEEKVPEPQLPPGTEHLRRYWNR